MDNTGVDPNEQRRLESLRSLNVLDTPPEERFDRIARLAQRTLGVPIVSITATPVRSSDGTPSGGVIIFRDVL